MIGIMSWKQRPYYVPFLFFMIFILAFNKCCEIKTVVWCMCCQSKNAVVLCKTRYWSKPPKVTVLDLRAISKAQISTHLECMGISNGKNMTFNNEFIVNICRVWNSVYSRKCRILIMLIDVCTQSVFICHTICYEHFNN